MSSLLLPTLLIVTLGACDNRQEQAQAAYAQYQAASVNGDLREARRALVALVAADDSNAAYWIELAKVSLQLTDYSGAYDAFQRAHELDRGNVEVLTAMTQLALRSGNLELAAENAKQLELVAPSDPAVPLTNGYVALRRGDFAEAERQVAALAAISPYDGSGKVLQSRILMAQDKADEAVSLLRRQIEQQPSDAESLRALASIYELREQWREAASVLQLYLGYVANDAAARVRLVEAELRSQQVEPAATATLAGVAKEDVDNLLLPWLETGKQDLIAPRLFAWARTADVGRRIAVSRFLASTSQPARVLELLSGEASLPVKAANVIPNALYGAALVQAGREQEGSARLDAVLKIDGTNREALRARALLRSGKGNHKQAIEDAQKLVAADQEVASSRLLLARIYAAAGDPDNMRRTLWDGFHQVSDNRAIFDALMPLVAKSDGPQAAERLSQEFYDKRSERLTRSFA
ncbi:tetratricopeptide repeat protein [Sphingomonas sp. LHG3443-2]|uniref:tetratricopeptide repeat protein n=1 Tax=Sphingomonas sp. LHG3443-2 TaxID=2804639 RepID=UPI003CF95337